MICYHATVKAFQGPSSHKETLQRNVVCSTRRGLAAASGSARMSTLKRLYRNNRTMAAASANKFPVVKCLCAFEVSDFRNWFISRLCKLYIFIHGLDNTWGSMQTKGNILTVGEDCPHLEVAGGQSDDGRLVQLTCDGRRKGQHLCETVKLRVFLLSPRAGCILRLLFHDGAGRLACRKRGCDV